MQQTKGKEGEGKEMEEWIKRECFKMKCRVLARSRWENRKKARYEQGTE